jgi:uncharacterized protein (TIGR03435 family)
MRPFLFLFLASAFAFAQPKFDIASIKISRLTGEGRNRERIIANPGSLTMNNVTLSAALQWAYRMKGYQVSGPVWLTDDRFDISAKAAGPADDDQLHLMLQNLLTERFKITAHRGQKDLPVYALIVSKKGAKLAKGNPEGISSLQGKGFSLTAQDTSMSELAELMTQVSTSRKALNLPPVIDKTGLAGRYTFTVDASGFLQSLGATNGPLDPNAIITGVQEILIEQLGLTVEMRKTLTDFLVIDRAEKLPVSD